MNKLISFIGMLLISINTYASSFSHAQHIYDKLVKSNQLNNAPILKYGSSIDINASWTSKTIVIYKGMLDYVCNDHELAFVLGHELANSYYRFNIFTADRYGAVFMQKAGYIKCIGVKLLKRINSDGAIMNPPSDVRYSKMGCK